MSDMRERVARAIADRYSSATHIDQPFDTLSTPTQSVMLWCADAALLACGYAEMRKALEELTTTCFAEFGEGENEPDNSSVFVGEDNDSITFGMLRRARSILERTGEK